MCVVTISLFCFNGKTHILAILAIFPTKVEFGGGACTLAWTKNPKLWVGWSLMVANDVSIPRECFAKISEFLKRNWLRAAHI